MNTLQNNGRSGEMREKGKEIAYKRLAYIRKLLPLERPAKCMISIVPGKEAAEISYSYDKKVAGVKNIFECNNIWACPVCARRVAFQRRAELIERLKGWPGQIFQYHLTMRHNKHERLEDLCALQEKAHHLFKSGWWFQEFKSDYKIIGDVNSREVTHASSNGWHPHMHTLVITELLELNKEEIKERITSRWQHCLEKVGASGLLNQSCFVTFRENEESSSVDYPIKWGIEEEISLGAVKSGRAGHENPFQMVERAFFLKYLDFDDGLEARAERGRISNELILLFREFLSVYSGARQLRYSKGLKKAFGLSDDDISNKNTFFSDFSPLIDITRKDYNLIVKKGKLLDLQLAYSTGDKEKVKEVLKNIGIDVQSY